ncbi:MAG: NAD(P)-dependent oxidoreductase [Bacteroidales bacterium]|nr:NAD(P)-dependent oxidoreductase [Bacteroidales bacterium]
MMQYPAYSVARRVFVFGATGFLGQHTVSELLHANAAVCGLTRPASPVVDQLPIPDQTQFYCVRGDALNRDRCIRALAAFEPDVILHLATAHSRMDEAIFAACRVAAPDVPVVVPVAAQAARRRETLQRYAQQFNRRVLLGMLPMLFGEGDRNLGNPIPRQLQAEFSSVPAILSLAEKQTECLYVQDAARGIVHLAELALDLTIPNASAIAIHARPTVTVADLLTEHTPPRLHPISDEPNHISDLTDWDMETPLHEAIQRTRSWLSQDQRATHVYPVAARSVA